MAIRHLLALLSGTVVSACATAPPDPNQPVRPACDQSVDCFYERNIRSFQVLDDRTVIVLVGRNQCPYKLELDGFFCDIGMSSFIAFDDRDGRICTYDRSYVAGGPFTRETDDCRVRRVTPMTDDELLEAYATKGLAPPLPAKGSGELEVEEEAPTDAANGATAPEAPPSPEATATTGDAAAPSTGAEPSDGN